MTALTEISGDKHVVTGERSNGVSRVMKVKIFAKNSATFTSFSTHSDDILDDNCLVI